MKTIIWWRGMLLLLMAILAQAAADGSKCRVVPLR
jgi:hypothetical protein